MRGRKAVKNIVSSLIQNIVVILCGFIIPKLIISNYGSDVNGLINSITQFLAYISLLDTGIGQVIKSKLYKPIAKKDKHEIENILSATERFYRILACIFLVYIVVLCFVYPMLVNNDFDKMFTISLLIIISFSTMAEYFFGLTYSTFLQADQKTYINSSFRIITTILNATGIVILILLGTNILLVKLLSSAFFILRPILLRIYVNKKYDFNLKNADKNYKIENKWDGAAQHVASVIHSNTDVAVLTIFCNVIEVSVYSVYLLVVNGVKIFVESLTSGIDATFGDMLAKNEKKQLNDSFGMYEIIYTTIVTIVFSCTIILIVPFVKIYTSGITDANYIRPMFAFLIVLAEFLHVLRLPYSSLTYAAGHFKQTMKGAWFEAFSNITISIIFVSRFGLVGVAIGTLFAMFIRTIEFNYHTSKYILERKISIGLIKFFLPIIQVLCVYVFVDKLIVINIANYMSWILYAFVALISVSIFVILTNIIIYKNSIKSIKTNVKNLIFKRV